MRWLAAIVALGAMMASPSVTSAATITEEDVRVQFVPGCSGSGYYHEWSRTIHPSLSESIAEHPLLAVDWGPHDPIVLVQGSEAVPGHDYIFRLLGDDRTTVLFETPFAVVTPDGGAPRFSIDVILDCSTMPYTVVPMPDTSLASPEKGGPGSTPILIGMVLLLTAVVSALDRMRPIGPNRP